MDAAINARLVLKPCTVQVVQADKAAWHPLHETGGELWRVSKHCDLPIRSGPSATDPAISILRSGRLFQVLFADTS